MEAGDIKLGRYVGAGGGDVGEALPNLQTLLENMACSSDAVIIGTVNNKSSQLTEDKSYIFTDYEMTVEEVLKDNDAARIPLGSNITVTRPGGAIRLNNRIAEAVDDSFLPFTIGEHYVLFLHFIPATGSYKAFSSMGSFELRDNQVIKLTKEQIPLAKEGALSFINNIRAAISTSCKNKKGAWDVFLVSAP